MPACISRAGVGVANVSLCAVVVHGGLLAGDLFGDLPEMRKRGHSVVSAGIIAGGTLGILLPPSITMILFAIAAGDVRLPAFAGIGPGRRW